MIPTQKHKVTEAVLFLIDMSNRHCYVCKSTETVIVKKYKRPHWYLLDKSGRNYAKLLCNKCHMRLWHQKRKGSSEKALSMIDG